MTYSIVCEKRNRFHLLQCSRGLAGGMFSPKGAMGLGSPSRVTHVDAAFLQMAGDTWCLQLGEETSSSVFMPSWQCHVLCFQSPWLFSQLGDIPNLPHMSLKQNPDRVWAYHLLESQSSKQNTCRKLQHDGSVTEPWSVHLHSSLGPWPTIPWHFASRNRS